MCWVVDITLLQVYVTRSFLAEVHRGQHVLEKTHCPEHCLPVTFPFFIFLEGVIMAIKCYPEDPHNNLFPVFNWKKKKKTNKETKGFFEILLLICVKVAQISKYVAAKSYWTSWGEGGGFFLCMRAKCCCFHTVISNWNSKWFSYHCVCRYIDFVLKEDCLKGLTANLFVGRSGQRPKQLLCVTQRLQKPFSLVPRAR